MLSFEFYLSKTQPDLKSPFQSPSKDTTKNINYANPESGTEMSQCEENTINKMMERISIKAEWHRRSLLCSSAV